MADLTWFALILIEHLSVKTLFTYAVYPWNVQEHFLHGVMFEWEQGSIFREIFQFPSISHLKT